ncbi:MAG: histidine kinase [Actinomycetota bacterium]
MPVSSRWAPRLAWLLFGLTIAAGVAAVWFGVLTRHVQAGDWGTSGVFPNLMFLAALLAFAVVGLVVATRQPGNAIGWILLQIGLVAVLSGAADGYAAYSIYVHPGLPGGAVILSFSQWLWLPSFGMAMTFLLLLFPDGHLPSPRWRWFAWVTAIDLVLISLGILLSPGEIDGSPGVHNVFGVEGAQFLQVAFAWFPIAIIASAASLIFRLRRARGAERAQIKWLVTAATIVAFFYAFILVVSLLTTSGSAPWILFLQNVSIVMFGLLPVSIAFSVLRYRLFDIDLVIRKAVLIGLMAGFITFGYLAVVAVVGVVSDVRTLSPITSAVAAFCVALAFAPVRRWARRASDRVVYGKRATPYEVLTEFGDQLAGAYAADDVLVRMARVLAEALGAERARVWLGPPDDRRVAATWPVAAPEQPDEHTLPVVHQGEELGALSVTMPANDPMDPAKEKLVADLASQAGLVLRNVGLTEALRQRLDELQAAQRRLVTAQDQERRRLERNIHDGAQQQLVALSVKMRLAQAMLERDPARADQMLVELQGDSQRALEDLRDLARGIYPPLLADKGLLAALEAQARKSPVPVEVVADGIGRFAQDAEAAVYFSCLEALQNVSKYANAKAVRIDVRSHDGHLEFRVHDDGDGFDPLATGYGTGLQGIADRLSVLEGSLVVTSVPGEGTTIAGSLPVGPTDDRVASAEAGSDRLVTPAAT